VRGVRGVAPRERLILRAGKVAFFATGPQDQWMMTPRMFLPSSMSW